VIGVAVQIGLDLLLTPDELYSLQQMGGE